MRRDFTQCEFCGNHTVRSHNTICDCCGYSIVPISTSARNRTTLERVIIAIGLALAVAFVLVLAAGHVRAQTLDIPPMTKNGCAIGLVPDGKGACVAPVMTGTSQRVQILPDSPGVQPLQLDTSGRMVCHDSTCTSTSGSLRVQISSDNPATLVIRNRENKLMLIRSIASFDRCQDLRLGLQLSPDIEFAECFR